MALLRSLGIEKDRWQETSESFKSQMSTLIGDVFISSAFLAYAGYFDQQSRCGNDTFVQHQALLKDYK
jgi:dynein heavy chain 1